MPRCIAFTLQGKRCKKKTNNDDLCFVHRNCEPVSKTVKVCIRHKKIKVTKKQDGTETATQTANTRNCYNIPRNLLKKDPFSNIQVDNLAQLQTQLQPQLQPQLLQTQEGEPLILLQKI